MTEDADLSGTLDDGGFRRFRALAWSGGAVLALLFIAGVFVFGRYGGGFVDGLSWRVGEVVAARAQSLADSGQPQAAARMFVRALQARFDDPQQRVWCYRRYGQTLMSLQQWPEATQAFQSALVLNNRDWPSHRQLCEALKKQELRDAMQDAARQWREAAAGVSDWEVESAEKYLK